MAGGADGSVGGDEGSSTTARPIARPHASSNQVISDPTMYSCPLRKRPSRAARCYHEPRRSGDSAGPTLPRQERRRGAECALNGLAEPGAPPAHPAPIPR